MMVGLASESESRLPMSCTSVDGSAGTTRPGSMKMSVIGPEPMTPSSSAITPWTRRPVDGLTSTLSLSSPKTPARV